MGQRAVLGPCPALLDRVELGGVPGQRLDREPGGVVGDELFGLTAAYVCREPVPHQDDLLAAETGVQVGQQRPEVLLGERGVWGEGVEILNVNPFKFKRDVESKNTRLASILRLASKSWSPCTK